jgi:hypothetical protein
METLNGSPGQEVRHGAPADLIPLTGAASAHSPRRMCISACPIANGSTRRGEDSNALQFSGEPNWQPSSHQPFCFRRTMTPVRNRPANVRA